MNTSSDRVLPLERLVSVADELRKEHRRIVFTNGCFDILHIGHLRYLEEAARQGDILIVGVNSDGSVKSLKKGDERPIVSQDERAQMVAALKPVDYVVIFDEPDPLKTILAVRPDVLVKGADWDEENIIGAKEVKSWGGTVFRARLINNRSTTDIIEKIRKLKI
ncbi:MAG: D-glycero-beta-D-manno-heptose 1-phosphate adenylyltransferase [Deltaproteobacteria bacterium]|nr:D-glycero-beta-D-manno-heptose 1-phosphate adenylyltransferase [Candidatus Zymogenaceae bacterium]